jgi:hypothetical protein
VEERSCTENEPAAFVGVVKAGVER